MHVPYSMDDSEPDLIAPWGSYDEFPDRREVYEAEYAPPQPMFVFYSEEELAKSDVYHKLLLRSLQHKDREIDRLRQEIVSMM